MKLVLISKCGPANLHIVNRVLSEWPTAALIRPYWVRSTRTARRQQLKAPFASTAAVTRRLWYASHARHMDRVVSQHLFGSKRSPAPPQGHEIQASLLNGPEGLELVRSLKPDMIVLSGAPILGPGLLSVPRYGVLNVHFGIAPHYRGSHTLFYALYREDYSRVGVTLHYVDEGVDTGPIVAQAFPQLEVSDTEATVQAKSATMAADLLLEFLARRSRSGACFVEPGSARSLMRSSSAPTEGRPQARHGHLYRFRDRSIWHDADYMFRRTVLRRRPDPREARLVRYF